MCAKVTNGNIDDCTAGNLGSALFAFSGSTAVATNTNFRRNWAGVGATVYSGTGSSVSLTDSLISFGTSGFTSGNNFMAGTLLPQPLSLLPPIFFLLLSPC